MHFTGTVYRNPWGHYNVRLLQQNKEAFMGAVAEYSGDLDIAHFLNMNETLFNAPALVYLTLGKGHTGWSIYDLSGFGLALRCVIDYRPEGSQN